MTLPAGQDPDLKVQLHMELCETSVTQNASILSVLLLLLLLLNAPVSTQPTGGAHRGGAELESNTAYACFIG